MHTIKKTILIITLILAEKSLAQNVGIGTAAPLSKLHIDSGSLLITGNTGNVPFNGAGTRFMWVPSKAAARFGRLDETAANNWHADSVGYFSIAAGKNSKAKGDSASIALGWNVSADGRYGSIALGDFANATGNSGAAAIGSYVQASGQSSIAIGQSAKAAGNFSHAIGNSSQASGYASVTYGSFDTATSDFSFAAGLQSYSSGLYAHSFGTGTKSTGINSLAIGQYSTASGNQATAAGNSNASSGTLSYTFGSNDTASGNNAVAVGISAKATGNYAKAFGSSVKATGSSSMVIGDQLEASGFFSQAYGNFGRSSGTSSFILGNYDTATADYSFAIGNSAYAKGNYSVALGLGARSNTAFAYSFGNFSTANGNNSFAIGNNNTSNGTGSTAAGNNSVSQADYSFTAGLALRQKSYGGFAAGLYNDTLDIGFTGSTAADNRIFQIGNGTADNARSNAITVLQNGHTGIGILNPLAKLDVNGTVAVNDKTLLLRGGNDLNHGLRYDTLTDGPYLYGFSGGILGTKGEPHSLAWDFTGNVTVRNQFSAGTRIIVDTANDNNGNLGNALVFGTSSGEGIASKRTPGGNQYGIDIYTASINRLSVSNSGNIGIGTTSPVVPLQFASTAGNKIALFQSGSNFYGLGTQASLLQVYTPTAADDIAFGYGNSSSFTENIRMDGSGSLAVKTNVTVQNGKGIIRTTDGTQKKQLSASVTINTSFLAGETKTFAVTWPESFTAAPDAYVGNITGGAGGWAEVIMTVSAAGTGGATLYVYNPKATSVTPIFTVKVIAIGAQ